jgi:glycosyltransferase involved in cell wall biosynthesis
VSAFYVSCCSYECEFKMRAVKPLGIGITCPSSNQSWLGGLHYVQHIILACRAANSPSDFSFRVVEWGTDTGVEAVFPELESGIISRARVTMPTSWPARLLRRIRRAVSGQSESDSGDLFRHAGIDVLFPVTPCDSPGVPVVFLLPDFQYAHLPDYYSQEYRDGFDNYYKRETARAKIVLLLSESARQDLLRFLPEAADKARVVFPASVRTRAWFAHEPVEVAARYQLPERFFVISNQVCAHKGYRTIARAVQILNERGIRVEIACTGKTVDYRDPGFFERLLSELTALGVNEQFKFLGIVPREDQIAMMRQAIAIIQPSEFEGWGAAMSDAKAIGKLTLASDLPVHREHQSPVARFIPTLDVEAWSTALAEIWTTATPGPDRALEQRAASNLQSDVNRVGREIASIFREAAGTARRA